MNKETLLNGLKTEKFGKNLLFYEVIDSTNQEAKKMIEKEVLPEGTVLLAARQTAGRGTDGNKWDSNNIEGLLFSLIVDYKNPINQLITFLPAIAVVNVLKKYYNIDAHAKWPNDVLVGSKKICGILCEGIIDKQLIIGVGINVNQRKFAKKISHKATSMYLEENEHYNIEDLFQYLMLEMEDLFHSDVDLRNEWLNITKMLGKEIIAKVNGCELKVIVQGLSPEGYLIVKHNDGRTENWIGRTGLDIDTEY